MTKQIDEIPLPNTTVKRGIDEMSGVNLSDSTASTDVTIQANLLMV